MKSGNLVGRLLRRNISVAQIAGYAVANLVGLAIVLTAIQFYRDATAPIRGDEGFLGTDYLVLSKQVAPTAAIFGGNSTLSDAEIADLKAQPWVEKVGLFTPSRFNVAASVKFGGQGMSSYMFFESIPDEFFDVKPSGWDFDSTDLSAEIPIVISKDYLALYNFGFAASRGLPQLSESLISSIPLRVSLSGNGRQDFRRARIAGFSSRLNTIAVPEHFMQWANEVYGDPDEPSEPSRVIVEVNDPGNPEIATYLNRKGLETAGDKLNSGKAAYFLSVASAVVIAIGLVISLLSFFILMLSIFLLLQKNREKMHELMMLGYTPSRTACPYYILVAGVNSLVWLLAVTAMLVASHLWGAHLESLGLSSASPWLTIAIGAVLMGIVTIANMHTIRRLVGRAFRD